MTEQQPKRGRGRPVTTGVTPGRHIRVGRVWDDAETIAKQRGQTITDVVKELLAEYVERHGNALSSGDFPARYVPPE